MSDRDRPAAPGGWRSWGRLLTGHVLPLFVTALFLLPLVWMVTASLRDPALPPPRTVELVPPSLTLDNFAAVFRLLPFDRYLVNSLVVVGFAVPATIVYASLAGFAMSQLERRSRVALVILSIGLLMVPVTALWLTRFLLFRWAGLTDTTLALIVPAVAGSSPLFVLLYYWAFRRVSVDTIETARLDGAGVWTAWWSVGLPQVLPMTIAVAVLSFIFYWNDFISPLLYLRSQDLYTLPMGLRQLQQLDPSDWPVMMAGALMLAVPAIVFFLLVQRLFLGDRGLGSRPE